MNERRLSPETFRTPDRGFGILPFWFLNGELDPEEMRFQLGELRDKDMQGVILHGRYGLEMPYIGETYLDRIALAVEEGNRLGLATWIYDEMNWPSGTADKRVLAERPDLAQRYLECVSFTIRGPWFMCLTGEDSRYVDFERSDPVAAFAISESGEVLDLTRFLSFEKVVPWEVPEGEWRLCYIVEKRADYYIDALDPESTATFLRLGYQPYADAVGTPTSEHLVGFYSDEPAMHYFLSSADNAVVPWTKHMFRRFAERNGYELRSRLPDLFFDVRPDTARVRHDFYTTLTEFYSDAYYRQIHEWCRERDVTFVAHLLYEEWLRGMVRVEGNLFKHYANMDVVGVDHLYPIIGTRSAPAQHVALKVASSAAHHFGSDRVICESFGGIFMDATMQRMKWIADWEFVLGVNVLNPHGFHYTLEGPRKRDWPPSMFYQYPWWRHYGEFSAYMTRLGEMLTGGRHVAKVAVLWPINAMFANYVPQVRTPAADTIESGLNVITDLLLRLHHDFDYLDEDVLAASEHASGTIDVGDEAYELVIVPPMPHVLLPTVEALERFVAGGGRVLSVLEAPATALGPDGLVDVSERMQALLSGERAAVVAGGAESLLRVAHEGDREMQGLLADAIAGLIDPDIVIADDELFSLQREKDGRRFHFVINPTFEERTARVSLPGDVEPALWDPSTGEALHVGQLTSADGSTSFELTLPPVGSVFLMVGDPALRRVVGANVHLDAIGDGVLSGHGPDPDGWVDVRTNGHVRRARAEAPPPPPPRTLDGDWRFEFEGLNAAVVTEWLARPQAEDEPDEGFTADAVEEERWTPMVPGAWSFQLPAEPHAYPVPVWFRAEFEVRDVPDRLELVIDGFDGADARVVLNGGRIDAAPVRSSFDAQMQSLDLTAHVRPGPNVLAIRLTIERATGGLLDNVKLMGTFALEGPDGSRAIVAVPASMEPGDWTKAGFPFFSGTATFRRTVDLPDPIGPHRSFLDVPMHDDVLEVHVNGVSAGVRLWHPYRVEITDLLRPGANEVAVSVTNTLANLLNAVTRPSGPAGPPTLLSHAAFEFDLSQAVAAASEGPER